MRGCCDRASGRATHGQYAMRAVIDWCSRSALKYAAATHALYAEIATVACQIACSCGYGIPADDAALRHAAQNARSLTHATTAAAS